MGLDEEFRGTAHRGSNVMLLLLGYNWKGGDSFGTFVPLSFFLPLLEKE